MVCCHNLILHELQVDIVPREERDDAAMMPRVPQPMSGAMPGMLHCLELKAVSLRLQCLSTPCDMTDIAGMGPQGYAWPPPNMMPPNMQTDAAFRPSVAMDPSMIPPYYSTGMPQQWQPQSMPVNQTLPQTQAQSDQTASQQMPSNQQQQ